MKEKKMRKRLTLLFTALMLLLNSFLATTETGLFALLDELFDLV